MLPILRRPFSGLACVTGDVSVSPYPSTILLPVSASKRSSTSGGSGAAPEKQEVTLVRSRFSRPGALTIALNIAGTPGNSVTRYLAMFEIICRMSLGLGISTMAAAMRTGKFIATVRPKTWKNGRQPSMTSLPGRASTNHAATCWTLDDRLRCVRTAAFATPVVPPVYCNAAGSSMSICTRAGLPVSP